MSPGPSCPIRPFSTELGIAEITTRIRGTLAPKDVARREARRVCSERLQSWRQRRRVEGDLKHACPWVIDAERPTPDTSASADYVTP
jgi:predicted alpha-1,6-mannanase (GH76 family)